MTCLKTLFAATAAVALAAPVFADVPPAPPAEYVAPQTIESACETINVTVYFAANEAMLSRYASDVLSQTADALAGCTVTEVKATVVTAEAHSDEAKAILSDARATAVLGALMDQGLTPQSVLTDIVVRQESGIDAASVMPMARRVDLRVSAEPGYTL